MQPKLLTVDEANELCIQALILMCQQNRIQKNKKAKRTCIPPLIQQHTSCISPQLSSLNKKLHNSPSSPNLQSEVTSQKSLMKQECSPSLKDLLTESTSWRQLTQFSIEKIPDSRQLHENQLFKGLVGTSSLIQEEGMSRDKKIHNFPQVSCSHDTMKSGLLPESRIKDLKRDLQIKSRGKICKTQQIDPISKQLIGYHLCCKTDPECPFHCFLKKEQFTDKGESLFIVKSNCEEHLKDCLEDQQEITFLKLTKLIDSMEEPIRQILLKREEMKPKEVLIWMAEYLGYSDHRFIYEGFDCKSYHKSAKKYFDNMVYRIKNPLSS